MTTEQLIYNYSPVGDEISIVICIAMLVIIERALYFLKDRKFIYLESAFHYIVVGATANLGFYLLAKGNCQTTWLFFLARDVYHLDFLLCLYCFVVYVKTMLAINGKLVKVFSIITRTLLACCMVLDVLTPVTKLGLYIEDGKWHDGMISAYNFFYVYAVLLLIVMLGLYAKRLVRTVRNCLAVTWVIVALMMGYQAVANMNSYTSFTYVLPILVVMILLHSKPFDDKTGSLSRSSYEDFVNETAKKGIGVDYVILKLDVDMFNNIPEELGKAMSSFWLGLLKNVILFNLTSDLFVFAVPKDDRNGDVREKVDEIVNGSFEFYYDKYGIPYKMVGLFDADFIEKSSDIAEIVSYLFNNMEDNTYMMVDDKKMEDLKLYKITKAQLEDIEQKNDMNDARVLAYCQPIRNMNTGKFDTAEALMRLEIPGTGIVMPGLFIPIAEKYNYIHTLTRIMLNKVCNSVKELEREGYQFKRISVNFTASELRSLDFCDELFEIIEKADIAPSKIGVELTESQSDSDFKIVIDKIKTLRDAGMSVYLDDIGTGYSNLDRIVRYDVDVVKFDRFFLLEAEKSEKIVKMLKQLSQAFRDMDYKLLYEGVETIENEKLCMSCGADYIQGFKYSKPVPIEELKNFFER